MFQSTVNLVKNIVGAGMLSLPAGVAAFSGNVEALVPAVIMTVILGLMSAYGFILIADACKRTGSSTYADAWAGTMSPGTAWLPSLACMSKAVVGCISFSMILGDCWSLILQPLGLPAIIASRGAVMVWVTLLVLIPLCNMRSLAPLAKFSVIGVLSNVYICFFIILRCLDGSYQPGGAFYSAVTPIWQASRFTPPVGITSTLLHPEVTVLLAILNTAFLCHYNAPTYFEQLAPGPGGNKSKSFRTVSLLGFGIACGIFSIVLVGGFLTFGKTCSGLILNSYAATDKLATAARAAIALSVTTSYPLVFFSIRKQICEMLGKKFTEAAKARPSTITAVLLAAITSISLQLHNLGTVAAFAGAVFGSFLIYIGPALMALRAQQRGIGPVQTGWRGKVSRAAQLGLVPLGLSLGIIGAYEALI